MSDAKSSLAKLKDGVSINKAREKIDAQIEKGHKIRDQDIKSRDDLEMAQENYRKWHDENIRLLKVIFNNESVVDRYHGVSPCITLWDNKALDEDIKDFREPISRYMENLKSILDEQEQIYELEQELKDTVMEATSKTKIFVVHGHDPIKDQLENLLLRWGFDPIILEDQANLGQTLIEKFEKNSSKVQYAIVLLTPDDKGCLKDSENLKPRARQNVIFELGYFFAKLGRNRVICLYKNDIERPTDFDGIAYIPFSNNLKDEVYRKLLIEFNAMGLTIKESDIK
jgi:predicted nucleotide-binding protein